MKIEEIVVGKTYRAANGAKVKVTGIRPTGCPCNFCRGTMYVEYREEDNFDYKQDLQEFAKWAESVVEGEGDKN